MVDGWDWACKAGFVASASADCGSGVNGVVGNLPRVGEDRTDGVRTRDWGDMAPGVGVDDDGDVVAPVTVPVPVPVARISGEFVVDWNSMIEGVVGEKCELVTEGDEEDTPDGSRWAWRTGDAAEGCIGVTVGDTPVGSMLARCCVTLMGWMSVTDGDEIDS